MYKITTEDAVELANDLLDLVAKVKTSEKSKTLMFSPKLGSTIIVDTDKDPHKYGLDPIIEVIP